RLRKIDRFGRQRRAKRQQARLRFLDGEQPGHSARQSPERPPLFSSSRIFPRTIARSSAFAISYSVSNATEAAVSASISTPVGPVVAVEARTETPSSSQSKSIVTAVSWIGW